MENQNVILGNNIQKEWAETDNFNNETLGISQETVDEAGNVVVQIGDKVGDTFKMVVDESKHLAPKVVDIFGDTHKRLEAKKRIISFIPNDVLYFGVVGLGVYFIIKKIL